MCSKISDQDVQLRKIYPNIECFHGENFLEVFKKHSSNLQLEQLQEVRKYTQDQIQNLIDKSSKQTKQNGRQRLRSFSAETVRPKWRTKPQH